VFLATIASKTKFSLVDSFVAAFVLTVSQILFVVWFCGWVFSSLSPFSLTALSIAMSAFICVYFKVDIGEVKKAFSSVIDSTSELINKTPIRIFFVLVVIQFMWLFFLGYLFPPYSHDALMYHVPASSYFFQEGKIYESVVTNIRWIRLYPKNLELLYLWQMVFLKSDTFINCVQVLFLLFGCAALFSLNRKLGVAREIAFFSASIFLFTPLVIQQSTLAMSDVAFASLFFITLSFLCGKSYKYACLGGFSGGIMLGVKGTGILFVCAIIAFMAARFIFRKNRLSKKKVAAFLLPLVFLGGFWYLKNWVLYGNPVFPVPVTCGKYTLFPGQKNLSVHNISERDIPDVFAPFSYWMRTWKSWQEFNFVKYAYYYKSGGFGPLFFIFFLPNLVYALYSTLMEKNVDFLILLIPFMLNFILFRSSWYSRHNIQLIGLFSISSGITLSHIQIKRLVTLCMSVLLFFNVIMGNVRDRASSSNVMRFLRMPVSQRLSANFYTFGEKNKLFRWISNSVINFDAVGYSFQTYLPPYPLWNYSNTVHCILFKTEREWRYKVRSKNIRYYIVKRGGVEEDWLSEALSVYENETYTVKLLATATQVSKP